MNLSDIFRRPALAERRSPNGVDLLGGMVSNSGVEAPVETMAPVAERIRALAEHNQAGSVVFQSVAVTALQMLDKVIQSERSLASAAISLAQREKIQGMIGTLEGVSDAIRYALSRRGGRAMNLYMPSVAQEGETSWWFALSNTMSVLEESTAWISTAVSSQPKGCATRLLSSVLARLLHSHYNKLLVEADQWLE